jgi:hypothetical protein
VEYGNFKRKDRGDFRDRNSSQQGRGQDHGQDRGRGFRERGDFRDRNDRNDREREESVFSKRVRAGKRRTYFFDVKKTKGDDYFITITESTRREEGFGYRRHKIFLYKEDFNRFAASLNEVVEHVKTDLMPDFDYEEFDRRQAEWEAQNRDMEHSGEFEDLDEHFPEDDDKPAKDIAEDTAKDTNKDDEEVGW